MDVNPVKHHWNTECKTHSFSFLHSVFLYHEKKCGPKSSAWDGKKKEFYNRTYERAVYVCFTRFAFRRAIFPRRLLPFLPISLSAPSFSLPVSLGLFATSLFATSPSPPFAARPLACPLACLLLTTIACLLLTTEACLFWPLSRLTPCVWQER